MSRLGGSRCARPDCGYRRRSRRTGLPQLMPNTEQLDVLIAELHGAGCRMTSRSTSTGVPPRAPPVRQSSSRYRASAEKVAPTTQSDESNAALVRRKRQRARPAKKARRPAESGEGGGAGPARRSAPRKQGLAVSRVAWSGRAAPGRRRRPIATARPPSCQERPAHRRPRGMANRAQYDVFEYAANS